jgi:hypothetical protein
MPHPEPVLSFQRHRYHEPASLTASPEASRPPAVPFTTPSPLRANGTHAQIETNGGHARPAVYRREAPSYEQVEQLKEQAEELKEQQKLAARHARFDCKVPGCESKYGTSG